MTDRLRFDIDVPTYTPAPGPAGRIQRTAGQVGAVTIVLDLWLAFGWFDADGWSEQQVLAVSAVGYLLVSVLHNVAGHLRSQTEVAPIEPAEPSDAATPAV